jgi:hypothetical protein
MAISITPGLTSIYREGSLLEDRVVLVIPVALVILSIAAFGGAPQDRQRDLGGFLR